MAVDLATALAEVLRPVIREEIEAALAELERRGYVVNEAPARLLTPKAFGALIGKSRASVYTLINGGMGGVVRVGATTRIDADAALAWLRERGGGGDAG